MTPSDNEGLREQLSRLIIENQSEDGSIDISDQAAMRDDLMALISQKITEAELSHFHYSDWDIGDDDVLRMGDYILCYHQRPHDGYETYFEGQIVPHHDNGMAVVIHNVDPNEPENSGDYASLQDMFMNGWEFSRIATLTTKQDTKEAKS